MTEPSLPRFPVRIYLSYTLSVVAPIMLCIVLPKIEEDYAYQPLSILTSILSVVVCTLMGGLWPGVVATLLSAISLYYCDISPANGFKIIPQHDLLLWYSFISSGLLVTLLIERFRHPTIMQHLPIKAFMDNWEKLRIIADYTYDWEYWRAPEGKYIWISPSFETITGYPLEPFLGDETTRTRVLDIIHPDDRRVWENHIAEIETIDTGPKELNFRIINANGKTIWISHTCKPIFGSRGEFLGRRGCNRDVTDHHQTVEELENSQKHLTGLLNWKSNILNVSAFGILAETDQRIITEVNKGFIDLFGYSEEEVIGSSVAKIHVSPETSEIFEEQFWNETSQKKVVSAEWQLRKKNGEIFWCSLTGSALDMQDLHKGVVWIIRDISERKQMELELRESELRFRTLFEQSIDAIAIMDSFPPCFRYVNPAFVQLFGYSQEEVRNLTGDSIWRLVYPDDLPALQLSLKKRMDGIETSVRYEFRIVRKDGEIRWVETVGYRSKYGEKVINQSIYRDITSRKLAAIEQQQLEIKLRQAQKMEAIGTLAGGIAHDFNNILGAILGYAGLARDVVHENPSAVHSIDQVIDAGQRASALVKQILAFSRQSESDCIPVNPARIVNEALNLLRPILPSTIKITSHLDTNNQMISVDPTQLHQIIMNLCTNAFHAMEHSGGMMELTLQECKFSKKELIQYPNVKLGKFIMLSVRDTGTGIPLNNRDRIFDPYFTTKEVGKGTGLGLSIIHGIVTNVGGFIICNSEEGRGTVFQVFFPVLEKGDVSAKPSLESLPQGHERILLIDDEEMLTELGKTMLENLGYVVTVYNDSTDALNHFLQDPGQFDMVITDQTMPGMTGFDLAQRILLVRPELPIILSTGHSSRVNAIQAKEYGIKGFVMKPVSRQEIAVLIRKLLDEAFPDVTDEDRTASY